MGNTDGFQIQKLRQKNNILWEKNSKIKSECKTESECYKLEIMLLLSDSVSGIPWILLTHYDTTK